MWLLGPTSIWQSHREEKRFPQHCQEWGGPLSTSQLLTDYTPSCVIVELSVVITWRMHTKNEISKDFINYNICIYMKIVCIITIYKKFWDQKRFEDLYSGFLLHSWGKSFAQPCPTLCVPTDCGQPGSSAHGIFQPRLLEWVVIPFSRGIFPAQGSNPGLLHRRHILYHPSHHGNPYG